MMFDPSSWVLMFLDFCRSFFQPWIWTTWGLVSNWYAGDAWAQHLREKVWLATVWSADAVERTLLNHSPAGAARQRWGAWAHCEGNQRMKQIEESMLESKRQETQGMKDSGFSTVCCITLKKKLASYNLIYIWKRWVKLMWLLKAPYVHCLNRRVKSMEEFSWNFFINKDFHQMHIACKYLIMTANLWIVQVKYPSYSFKTFELLQLLNCCFSFFYCLNLIC